MEEPKRERDWEHWPSGRPTEESLRNRLRHLFASTTAEQEEVIEGLLGERSRELEAQAARLAEAVADLERREERTRELRAAVEDMLRRGSAELDERHAQLNALADELADREATLRRSEGELGERRQELGAVELHRAAVARREEAIEERVRRIGERERELAEHARELGEREASLAAQGARVAARAAEAEALRHELAAREATVAQREARAARAEEAERAAERVRSERTAAAPEPPAPEGHLLFVPAGGSYRIVAVPGAPPAPGERVELDDGAYRIGRIGASPLPGDSRRCAFLEPLGPAG